MMYFEIIIAPALAAQNAALPLGISTAGAESRKLIRAAATCAFPQQPVLVVAADDSLTGLTPRRSSCRILPRGYPHLT